MSIVSISFPFFPARLNYKMLKNGTTWNFKVQNFFLPNEAEKSDINIQYGQLSAMIPVIPSSSHLVIWSFGHFLIWSFGHLVIRSIS